MLEERPFEISPQEFKEHFDRTLAGTTDINLLSRVIWLAGMFLDRHHGAFELPRRLTEQLLTSTDYDQLLAGLKGIRHTSATPAEIVAEYLKVLKRNEMEEKCAALYQLQQFLGDGRFREGDCMEPAIVGDLRAVLFEIMETAADAHRRECAESCISYLNDEFSPN